MSKSSETPSAGPAARAAARLRSPEFSLELSLELSFEQRRTLLGIAHQSILGFLGGQPLPDAPPSLAGLSEPRGVFTTLYLTGDLPGGLGPEAHRELHREARRVDKEW